MTGMHHIKADHEHHRGVPATGDAHPGSKRQLLLFILLAHIVIIVVVVLLALVIHFATN